MRDNEPNSGVESTAKSETAIDTTNPVPDQDPTAVLEQGNDQDSIERNDSDQRETASAALSEVAVPVVVSPAPRAAIRPPGPPPEPTSAAAASESLDVAEATTIFEPDSSDDVAGQDFTAPPSEMPDHGTTMTTKLFQPPAMVFQPPVPAGRSTGNGTEPEESDAGEQSDDSDSGEQRATRRRRRRGGRGRGRTRDPEAPEPAGRSREETSQTDGHSAQPQRNQTGAAGADKQPAKQAKQAKAEAEQHAPDAGSSARDGESATSNSGSSRRRRRRRRSGSTGGEAPTETETSSQLDDPPNTVVRVREPRPAETESDDEVRSVRGSTRLEAKKQRRREGREQGRRRPPVITESEFLARREAVQRDMVVRRVDDGTQIAVLEDDVLVEHYVDRSTHKSLVGSVYLGRVQNVLPSMEAAFVDIGKGRNAVLYAGEVNWDATGLEGQPKRIESALKSGQSVLVQVTKEPTGQKGARLTSQISLPGRYLVYVPDGSMTGISRKLPDNERSRLKQILKRVVPEDAGVIVRTAAEGASEEELQRDIERLSTQWESIKRKSRSASAPSLLSSEPDLTVRVVRDVFNEDFSSLVVAGDEAWTTVEEYVNYVAPHLAERLTHWSHEQDVFAAYRVDEQIAKALERKVWLPSGGSLVVDRTEAMTVIDVNTGKFTGQGGNLEETVTKNNLEAAEEIVRQLRLRDIGGIIVIDFIDMVLESNRDLVLRRMLECLSRDRTKHQVAEVTSLGLVQMTRKRVGQGLLEAFSHTCTECFGRGLLLTPEPVDSSGSSGAKSGSAGTSRKRKAKGGSEQEEAKSSGGSAKRSRKSKDKDKESKESKESKDKERDSEQATEASEDATSNEAAGAADSAETSEEVRPKRRRTRRSRSASSESTVAEVP